MHGFTAEPLTDTSQADTLFEPPLVSI